MTISTTAAQTTLAGNGSTMNFTFNFVVDSVSDIEVIFTNSSGVQTTLLPSQYTVAINPTAIGSLWGVGGFVTYPLLGSPIAAGTSLTIQRVIPLEQTTSISNQGDFFPQDVESALDTTVMQLQQVSARTGQMRGTWITNTAYNYGDTIVDGPNGNNTNNIYLCAFSNTSGVWTTDLAAGKWSLVLNVQGIINTLPTIPSNDVLANITGSPATPTGVSVSALLDAVLGNARGDIIYRGASGWTVLTAGATGQLLETQGAGADPVWASSSSSGTVTQVNTGTGLTGGPVTLTGTISLATAADSTLLANISGSTAAPGSTTLSAILDYILGNTQGDIIYRNGTVWTVLAPGSSGQFLQTQGGGQNPRWATASGGASSIANPGYYTFAGGLIQQWGTQPVGGNSSATVTLPLTFPTNFWNVQISSNTNNASTQSADDAEILSTSQFIIRNHNSATATFSWFVIGN